MHERIKNAQIPTKLIFDIKYTETVDIKQSLQKFQIWNWGLTLIKY